MKVWSEAQRDLSPDVQEEVQIRLHLPPDGQFSCPESLLVREFYDCPNILLGDSRMPYRVIVAAHPADHKQSPIGKTREGVVYEVFYTQLPQERFTAADVVSLYLHRGAFEPLLADEDPEICAALGISRATLYRYVKETNSAE